MGLSCLSNQYWIPGHTDDDLMLQQSLKLPQVELELDLDIDNLVWFQDEFTLADTSIDPLFFNPSPQPPLSQSQSQTCQFDQLQQDFQQHQQQCFYDNKRRKKTQDDEAVLQCTNTNHSIFDSQLVNQTNVEVAWMLPDVTFPPVFASGGNNSNRCGRRVGGGGMSAQSIAARQRRRKIGDKTHELGRLIPGGHKMNTADMFHSASMYVKFLQAQIGILTLTNNSHLEGLYEEQQHFKLVAESLMVQEKLYAQEKCMAPQKLLESLSNDSKLQFDHPSLVQQINTLVSLPAQVRH